MNTVVDVPEYVTAQIGRWSQLRGFMYLDERALRELTLAFAEAAPNPAAAERLGDEIVRTFDELPTPRQLREVAWSISHDREKPLGKVDCVVCHGVGWVSRTVSGYEGAERCPCVKASGGNQPC